MKNESWRTAPWWKTLGAITWWVFTRIWAPMMAFGWPALIIYGLMNPRPADLGAIELQPNEVPLLIGIASGGSYAGTTSRTDATSQRSYIVLPRTFSDASVIVVNEDAGIIDVSSEKGTALLVLAVWLICIYATWRFIVAPCSRYLTTRWSGP